MQEKRKFEYKVETAGNAELFTQKVREIAGVLSADFTDENSCFEYEIDGKASDYDVFSEILGIADETGTAFNFELDEKKETEKAEEGQNEVSEEESEEEYAPAQKKKKRKSLPEWIQRIIELSVSLIALIVGIIFSEAEYFSMVAYAVAFAASGYEVLYRAAVGFFNRRPLSGELLLSLALIGSLFLGDPGATVAATLIFSVISFVCEFISEIARKKSDIEFAPEKCTVMKNGKPETVEGKKVAAGDILVLEKQDVCYFDGVCTGGYVTVLRSNVENGEWTEVEVQKGEKILKGDVALTEARVRAERGFYDGYGEFEKAFVAADEKQTPAEKRLKNKGGVFYGAVGLALLLFAFVVPVFYSDYADGLRICGGIAVAVGAAFGFSGVVFAERVAAFSSLVRAQKRGALPLSVEDSFKLKGINTLFFDYENALSDKNGQIKEDSFGAVRETRDIMKKSSIALLTLLREAEAEELCKKLKINEYYCFSSEQEKINRAKELLQSGTLLVTDAKTAKAIKESDEEGDKSFEKGGLVIALEAKDSSDYGASACVLDDAIAYAPYLIKSGKRCAYAGKFAKACDLIAKAVVAGCAAAFSLSVWAAALIAGAAQVLAVAVSAFTGADR